MEAQQWTSTETIGKERNGFLNLHRNQIWDGAELRDVTPYEYLKTFTQVINKRVDRARGHWLVLVYTGVDFRILKWLDDDPFSLHQQSFNDVESARNAF